MSRLISLAAALGFIMAQATPAAPLAVHTFPAAQVYSYEMDGLRGTRSAVLQNLSVVNPAGDSATITHVSLELVREGRVVQQQSIDAIEIGEIAKNNASLAKSGALEMMRFQFQPQTLLGKNVTLAGSPTLAKGTALLMMQRLFAWRGKADTLRVTVDYSQAGKTQHLQHELPIVNKTAATALRFPLRGAWFVGAGPSLHTAHRWAVPEEFAFDIARLGADGRTCANTCEKLSDYYAYGADVLAAADGEVVAASGDTPESTDVLRKPKETDDGYIQRVIAHQGELLAKGGAAVIGNHVVIKHRDGEYSSYMHLKTGSVAVKVGQHVSAGQLLGKLGNSGNSTEPHLHFQLCDGADPLDCSGIPMHIANAHILMADFPREIQSGDVVDAQ